MKAKLIRESLEDINEKMSKAEVKREIHNIKIELEQMKDQMKMMRQMGGDGQDLKRVQKEYNEYKRELRKLQAQLVSESLINEGRWNHDMPVKDVISRLNESSKIPNADKLIGSKSWADSDTINHYQSKIDRANSPKYSDAFRKYIKFVVEEGHITPSASSVFEDWIDKDKRKLSMKEIEQAMDDLWPRTDDDAKIHLKAYASKRGIK